MPDTERNYSRELEPAADTGMKVIPHPNKPGTWTILMGGRIYGQYDRKDLAVSTMLTRMGAGVK